MQNGKGDTYRKVNKKVSDAAHDRIFGKREEKDFQKCHKHKIKLGENHE